MKLFVPLICYNHTANTEWMMSTMKLLNFVKDQSIPCTFYPIFFESLVSRARNAAVAHFLQDEEATHLLFIDSDIIFEPEDVVKLIQAKKEVVGGMYPKKYIKWDHIKKYPEAQRVDFPVGTSTINSEGFIETKYAPTGFLMIAKTAINRLIKSNPHLKYRNDIDGYGTGDTFYDLFHVGIKGGIYESEDWGFSSLWREEGEAVYIHPEVNLKHVGWHEYEGNLKKYILENR
jgi:choline kinase